MNRKFFIFVGVVIFIMYAYATMGEGLLSAEMARNMIQSGDINTVVDVRTKREWDLGHYKGAIHAPGGNLTMTPHSAGILVYCNTGQRARAAAEKIRGLGFENVYYIKGGYWTLLRS